MRFTLLMATALILGGCVWSDQSDTYRTVSIIHTNDLHSHFLPSDAKYQDCEGAEKDCLGGYGRIKTFIEENRKDDTLVLDAGDRFSGTVFYTLR
ncbi:MAG: multifunctional 2',3'-cyclic-nucleotide 2'-phosphodiesterase/5'-nucleotidase/3'-nucleotidase, partial [Alphaproteobacteria bacterium]|nr:multifunctional 2',3'-cyclic-nucleotide 2'-phosphodiesterase/5'-nucleotidase/3'-nucleotidase [Alphaproteobacteria bacterium]